MHEKIESGNIYNIKNKLFSNTEIFEDIFRNDNIKIERIVSTGGKTEDGIWLCDNKNEWVLLLQGKSEIVFENNNKIVLNGGDYVFIPSNTKHRVEYTSENPECIWIAVFFK